MLLLAASDARARVPRIDLPAATLDRALVALAGQASIEIASTEPGLGRIHTGAISGRLSARAALDRLLAGSGYRALPIAGGFRIVRASPLRRHAKAPAPAAPDVVVTASKQRVLLARYPGSIATLDTGDARIAGLADSDAMLRVAPVLQGTALGPGRNKLFVRGIADSSFNGATQSTASVYFGDVQLSYSGADPDLKLVDVDRVEILEGPQGTLYGAGSIGGIIRITPAAPDPTARGGFATLGSAVTLKGGAGYDGSAGLNLPLGQGAALRLVGYRESDGGYIDDPSHGARHVNRTDTSGGRAALRLTPAPGWTVDASGLFQRIGSEDAQYADAGTPLARRSFLPQPFANNIALGRLVLGKIWDSGLQLTSATAVVDNRSHESFDASRPDALLGYIDNEANLLVTQETRLSRTLPGGASWVVGFALLRDRNAQDRQLTGNGSPTEIVGVTNVARSASMFGEVTHVVVPRLLATVGVRGTLARNEADPSFNSRGNAFFAGQETRRLDPTVALTYAVPGGLSVYARYQSGFRTGGLAVARGVGRVASYDPDSIVMGELGVRYRHGGAHPLSLTAALSHADWTNIQADLIDRRGTPYTANIGSALIDTFELTAGWEPLRGMKVTVSTLVTSNVVHGPLADTSMKSNRRLAQTPPAAADAALDYGWQVGRDRLSLGATASYVGRALLGPGDLFDIGHRPYTVLGATGGWQHGRWTVTLTADNLLDARNDRFPYGNPFLLGARSTVTPLRPTTVRLATGVRW